MKNKLFLSIYLGCSVFYLLITVFNQEEIARVIKPFLLPILFIAAITLTAKKEASGNNKSAILTALLLDAIVVVLFIFIGYKLEFRFWQLLPFLLFWYGPRFCGRRVQK